MDDNSQHSTDSEDSGRLQMDISSQDGRLQNSFKSIKVHPILINIINM